jgi:hypothetical protein
MALAISMMMLTLLTALAGALVLGTVTETAIAASYREGVETFYAAEAVVEFVIDELDAAGNWQEIVDDGRVSDFADGPPAGTRQVGSITIDLAAAAADIVTAARESDYDVVYQLFAYGRLADLIPAVAAQSPYYLVVCIGGLDTDETEELSMMRIVGRAYGPTGSRRSVIVTVNRPSGSEEPLRVVSWHELR